MNSVASSTPQTERGSATSDVTDPAV